MSESLTPYLTVSNAAAATDFYTRVFGAVELRRHAAPDNTGRLMHVHLQIHGSDLMLSDDFPEHMGRSRKPESLGGSPVTLHVHVEKDIDAIFAAALAAGAVERMPLMDQFWGDRYGQFTDPFGQEWSIGQTIKTVTEEELIVGAKTGFERSSQH